MKGVVGICLTCGCQKPTERHDPAAITLDDLTAAADAAGIDVRQAAQNLVRTLPVPGPLPALYIDVDGVLAFQPEGSILAINARFDSDLLVFEADGYPVSASLPSAQADWLGDHAEIIAANLAPDTKAAHVLRCAQRHGYNIAVLTERPPELRDLTDAWLKAWRIPCDRLLVVGPGGKESVLSLHGPDDPAVLIDDSPINVDLAHEGVQVWQPARPYNQPTDGVWRFEHWHDAAARLGLA
jgi:uncharacterized HAD superfamily protein